MIKYILVPAGEPPTRELKDDKHFLFPFGEDTCAEKIYRSILPGETPAMDLREDEV